MKNFLLVVFLLVVTPAFAASKSTPETVVNKFYKYHFSHDMGFTEKTLKLRISWLTPSLLDACRIYFAIPENPDEPPYINGDPFTGSQEYPSKFAIGKAKMEQTAARVPITFTWKEDGHSTNGEVVLKKINATWLIDDIQCADQDSFRKMLSDASK